MISFVPLGGADDIGASCYYLNIDGTGILIDCGIHPRKKGVESLPDFNYLENKELDFVFISHAHQDHIGALPFLVKLFPHVRIFCTSQTVEIARLTLHNSINILKKEMSGEDDLVLYSHEEVDMLLRSVHTIDYGEEINLSGMRQLTEIPITVSLNDAGHILGSASIMIEYDSHTIFYTGDICLSRQVLMNGACMPNKRIDNLIIESTYAGTDSKQIGEMENETNRFVSLANKIISNNGSVLIPVFSLGKMQEMLANISKQVDTGNLTESIIYTGGIARDISHLYDKNRYLINYTDPNFELKDIDQFNYFDITDLNYFKRHPGIVLATSGMILKGTTSYDYTKYWLKQKQFGIFIVGYMDESTPGYLISQSKKGDIIKFGSEEDTKVECSINKFYFPTHSKREELIQIVKRLKPRKVAIVHGEEQNHKWLGEKVLEFDDSIKVFSSNIGSKIIFND